MNSPNEFRRKDPPTGSKMAGVAMILIGALMALTIIFPFVGTAVALVGIVLVFTGIGLCSFGSRRRRPR